jgi:hypothetical protein
MPVTGFIRSCLIGSVGLTIVASGIGLASISFGSVIVGETRRIVVDLKPQAARSRCR